MAKMNDREVAGRFARRRDDAVNFSTTEFTQSRLDALRFYRGDPEGELAYDEGNSSIVSRDTMEAIESMLPGLLRPFVSGDETVRFEPRGPEDEESAKQATEYINWLFNARCDAFALQTTMMKDGLLFRLGAAKVALEVDERSDEETYNGLSEEEYGILMAQPDIEIVGEPTIDEMGGIDCKVRRKRTDKRIAIYSVAPDELLFDRQLVSLDSASFVAHRCRKPVFELIDMGLPKKLCMELEDGDDSMDMGREREERFDNESFLAEGNDDPLTREVWVTDGYIRMDVDGDGYPEWRHIIMAGAGSELLLNEPADGHPFVAWTPIPIPHKFVGLSIFDIVRDLQAIKTALWRETLNNLYLHNRPQREVVEGQVNIDDLLNPRVGGLIRVKQVGMVRDVQTPSVIGSTMPMIEYSDTVREARTGSTRYNQGMDANSLNKTATGVQAIMGAAQQRLELVARQYSEQALKPLFGKLLELVSKNPDIASVVRLRGEWVQVDPRAWANGYDMSIAVGLGTGDKTQIVGQLMQLLQVDQQIVALQGGVDGPIVTLPNVYEKLKRLTEAMGLKGIENYYTEPPTAEDGEPAPQEGPSPEQQAMMAQQQAEQQAEMAKQQAAMQQAEMSAQVELQKAQIKSMTDIEIARMKIEADAMMAANAPKPTRVSSGSTKDGDNAEVLQEQIDGLAAVIERVSRPKVLTVNRDPMTGLVASIEEVTPEPEVEPEETPEEAPESDGYGGGFMGDE